MHRAGLSLGCALLALSLGPRPLARAPQGTPWDKHAPQVIGEARLVAVGDIIMHQDVQRAGREAEGGLAALWSDVTPLFKGADLAFANLESPIAPRSGQPGKPYQFNGPPELVNALQSSGLTLFALANNHAFDQGRKGLKETLEHLEAAHLTALGAGGDKAGAERLHVAECHGLKLAFLAFTDIFNLDLDRKATEPWVRPLDDSASQAVREAKAQADAVVVSLHWGREDCHVPVQRQRKLVALLAEAGADLIIGHHPHVLQPMELIEKNGNRTVVAYSLGNFVANQDRFYRADLFPVARGDCRDGAALEARFVKLRMPDGSVKTRLEEVGYEPLWTENNCREFQAKKSVRREIRVIRVNAAIERTWSELEALSDPTQGRALIPGDKERRTAILAKQEYLRTLLLRKQRMAEILGKVFEK